MISHERQSELRQLVGRMLYQGLRQELKTVGMAITLGRRGRQVSPGEQAEFEFIAQELRKALDRATDESTGDLMKGRISARENDPEFMDEGSGGDIPEATR